MSFLYAAATISLGIGNAIVSYIMFKTAYKEIFWKGPLIEIYPIERDEEENESLDESLDELIEYVTRE